MIPANSNFEVRLATSATDLAASQRLRYDVFVVELGGDGDMVDHQGRLERDRFDAHFDHLVLIDHDRKADPLEQVVGVYRLMKTDAADQLGQFYTDDEYDLSPLRATGRNLLELGRSCLHADYRGGTAMLHLWSGLADYVQAHEIEIMFGVASFHGTDIQALSGPLSFLHQRHLAPPELRVRSRKFQNMDLIGADKLDRVAAMAATPSLIKAYLRLGGYVGEGAFVDHAFNTTDVCLVMDTQRMNERQLGIYTKKRSP